MDGPPRSDEPERDRIESIEGELVRAREEIAELRLALARSERERARLQSVIDTIPYPVFAKSRNLRYSVCNPAFERYLGKSSGEILGKSVYEVAEQDKADVYHAADSALLAMGGTQCYETKVRFHDGSDRDVIFHKAVLRDEAGEVDGIYGILCDITDLRAAEAHRAKLESQLQHAEKLQSIGQLAGGVAHDLNNLLTPILGYSSLLLADIAEHHPHIEPLEGIRMSAERARDLVRQLLIFGRRQVLELQPLDVSDLVDSFEVLLRRTIRENIRMEVSRCSGPAWVRADAGQIQQVITNLAVNAQDAMPDGGLLRIDVSRPNLEESYCEKHPGVTPGPHVLIEVSDTGCGISADTVERIFEPFFTTKPIGRGTGLGLSTAYGIVKQHGGHIVVYSEPGFGSTFKVYLPCGGTAPATKDESLPSPDVPSGTETVLVLEDEESVRKFAHRVLESLGYRVTAVGSVREAYSIIEVDRRKFDLLLTDVVMPDANGKQVHDRLVRTLPGLRVLFMSGYNVDVISHHGVLDSGVQFLQKPFTRDQLARTVRRALDDGSVVERRSTAVCPASPPR